MRLMIPSISIKATLAGFEALGLETAVMLQQTNLTYEMLEAPFHAVPNELFHRIWALAFQQRPDPTLPTQAGLSIPYSEFGMLDHLVATADTVGEGFHILNLFLWLVATNLSLQFTHHDHDWVYVINEPNEPSSVVSEQWTLAIMYKRFSNLITAFSIEEVHLSLDNSAYTQEFAHYWGVPVHLGQAKTGFRLAKGVWNLVNQKADPLLKQTLRSVAEQVELKQVEEAPLIYAIRTRLPDALSRGAFSIQDIASQLGLSKRTLQRRLSAENLTFQELLDLYRQEKAMLMLNTGQRNIGEIAYALGYNEQSSFNRAFRRWTGESPSSWAR